MLVDLRVPSRLPRKHGSCRVKIPIWWERCWWWRPRYKCLFLRVSLQAVAGKTPVRVGRNDLQRPYWLMFAQQINSSTSWWVLFPRLIVRRLVEGYPRLHMTGSFSALFWQLRIEVGLSEKMSFEGKMSIVLEFWVFTLQFIPQFIHSSKMLLLASSELVHIFWKIEFGQEKLLQFW